MFHSYIESSECVVSHSWDVWYDQSDIIISRDSSMKLRHISPQCSWNYTKQLWLKRKSLLKHSWSFMHSWFHRKSMKILYFEAFPRYQTSICLGNPWKSRPWIRWCRCAEAPCGRPAVWRQDRRLRTLEGAAMVCTKIYGRDNAIQNLYTVNQRCI